MEIWKHIVEEIKGRKGKLMIGIVKGFDTQRGYGFIRVPGMEKDVFCYFNGIPGVGRKNLTPGGKVEFDISLKEKMRALGPDAN